jgi:hypothetical protein
MYIVRRTGPAASIVPARDDPHDRAYRFSNPGLYLSTREHVRLLLLRSDFQNGLRCTGDNARDMPESTIDIHPASDDLADAA